MYNHSQVHLWGDLETGKHIINTWSSTQACTALSSGEAEYYGIVKGCSMALGLQSLMRDLGEGAEIRVATDSSAAKAIAERLGLGSQRHIETQYLWIQEQVRLKIIQLGKVHTPNEPS